MSVFSRVQIEKYADALIWGLKTSRAGFKKQDFIMLRCDLEGMELGEVLYRKLIQSGYNVAFRFLPTPQLEKDFYVYSDEVQRKFIAPGEREFAGAVHGNILIHAPSSLTHLKGIDTKKQGEVALARKQLRDLMTKNEDKGLFGWTLCTYPTAELAKQAKLSLKEYAAQIAKACFLNEPSPAKKWEQIKKQSEDIKRWLKSLNIQTIRTESESMDFEVTLGENRLFKGVSGHNIPSFEIFTSPDWRGTNGMYYANLPAFRGGNYVEGIRIEFKNGRAVRVRADKGAEYLKKIMMTDRGAAQIGEYSLTDKRFSKIDKFMADTLFDENHGGKYGNCHIAIGSAYADTFAGDVSKLTEARKKELGFNDSAVHWDLVNTENKKVTAKLKNGKSLIIYENGQFQR